MAVDDKKDNTEDYRNRYNYPGRTRDLVIWIIVTVATLALLGAYVISSVFKIDMSLPDWVGCVAGYVTTLGFIIGGIIGFINTRRKLRERLTGDVETITGVICGYGRGDISPRGKRSRWYPVYEFYIDGERFKMPSTIATGKAVLPKEGTTVELIYNRTTGELFCVQDVRTEGGLYWILVGVGVIFFTLLLLRTLGIIG